MKYLNCALTIIQQWFMLLFYLMTQHTQEPYPWITEEQTSSDFPVIGIAPLSLSGKISILERKSQKPRSPRPAASMWPATTSLHSPASCFGKEAGQAIVILSGFGRPGMRMWILQDCGHTFDNPRRMPCIPDSMNWHWSYSWKSSWLIAR